MQKARREQAIAEKEEELREAERAKKLAQIRAASTAVPIVYATENMTSEELASFRKTNPHVKVIPFEHGLHLDKMRKIASEAAEVRRRSDELPA